MSGSTGGTFPSWVAAMMPAPTASATKPQRVPASGAGKSETSAIC